MGIHNLLKKCLPDSVLAAAKINLKYRRLIYGIPFTSVDHVASVWSIISNTYGFNRSLEAWRCLDQNGDPIPWITYPAMEYLSGLNFSGRRIFEYGAGASTLWWAGRAANVVSVESDREWIRKLQPGLPSNCQLIFRDGASDLKSYVDAMEGQFDCIVVDGLGSDGARYACCRKALEHLKPGGVIILDNSDWLPRSCELLRNSGLAQVDFNGFNPLSESAGRTSLFLSQPFQIPHASHRPAIGGVEKNWEKEIGKG